MCAIQAQGQRVAEAFKSCSGLPDQYHIVLGNKHWAFSFVNLLKHIINPGALILFPSSLSTYTYTTSSSHLHVSTESVTHCSTLCLYWNCGIWRRKKVVGMNICITMSVSGLSAHNVSHSYIAREKICELLKGSSLGCLKKFPTQD